VVERVSRRARQIPAFLAMEVLEKAQVLERQGRSIIHLELGEPDFPTPRAVVEAALRALEEQKTHYTHSLGLLELREAICRHYKAHYGVSISPEQILVTCGTSPAMLLLFSALLDSGDEVILPTPHYACYPQVISFAGGRPVYVETSEVDGFQVPTEIVRERISPRTKAILINSPANPTGAVLEPAVLEALSSLGPTIVSDEIYHGLVYSGKEQTILQYTDNAFVLNGFSKAYAMTGWRLGYLIAPPEFIGPLQRMHQNFFISASDFVQWAAVAALEGADQEVARMRQAFDQRRRYLVPALRDLGFGVAVEPQGAFYVLANARHWSPDSRAFASEILEKAGVAVTPGIDFGQAAEGYIRFTYANSLENLKEAVARLRKFLHDRTP
jgi:aspartate/methionine/tyrosine aminotransferase